MTIVITGREMNYSINCTEIVIYFWGEKLDSYVILKSQFLVDKGHISVMHKL